MVNVIAKKKFTCVRVSAMTSVSKLLSTEGVNMSLTSSVVPVEIDETDEEGLYDIHIRFEIPVYLLRKFHGRVVIGDYDITIQETGAVSLKYATIVKSSLKKCKTEGLHYRDKDDTIVKMHGTECHIIYEEDINISGEYYVDAERAIRGFTNIQRRSY